MALVLLLSRGGRRLRPRAPRQPPRPRSGAARRLSAGSGSRERYGAGAPDGLGGRHAEPRRDRLCVERAEPARAVPRAGRARPSPRDPSRRGSRTGRSPAGSAPRRTRRAAAAPARLSFAASSWLSARSSSASAGWSLSRPRSVASRASWNTSDASSTPRGPCPKTSRIVSGARWGSLSGGLGERLPLPLERSREWAWRSIGGEDRLTDVARLRKPDVALLIGVDAERHQRAVSDEPLRPEPERPEDQGRLVGLVDVLLRLALDRLRERHDRHLAQLGRRSRARTGRVEAGGRGRDGRARSGERAWLGELRGSGARARRGASGSGSGSNRGSGAGSSSKSSSDGASRRRSRAVRPLQASFSRSPRLGSSADVDVRQRPRHAGRARLGVASPARGPAFEQRSERRQDPAQESAERPEHLQQRALQVLVDRLPVRGLVGLLVVRPGRAEPDIVFEGPANPAFVVERFQPDRGPPGSEPSVVAASGASAKAGSLAGAAKGDSLYSSGSLKGAGAAKAGSPKPRSWPNAGAL